MNILMLMTGSIACAKATGLISLWRKNGHQVKVIASASALKFVGIATLEGLSGQQVAESTFDEGNMMDHINLSREADIIILAPATANSINKLTNGTADDMITTTWIAALELNKPMYIAPAMNAKMWDYPATQKSISQLSNWGINILSPQSGDLACGEKGSGRMMEIDQIDAIVMKKNNQHILITAGGTREFIDGVRYIGNLSTGKTGAKIADFYTSQGYNVTWLGAKNAQQPKLICQKIFYETFNDLQILLRKQLKTISYVSVIHAAAISDFSVSSVKLDNQEIIASRETKLPTSDTMSIQLKQNPKLISHLKQWSINQAIQVIAFKLTNTNDKGERLRAVNKLIKQEDIHFVAHNDLSEIHSNTHSFNFYQSTNKVKVCSNTLELCKTIQDQIS
ncbi:MAG: bifunctional phosphopantothenoylcysteine decarboxylase/phosphopantothenate--cysteine ligase CoaBC [Marinicellaceae bacterium]